MDLTNQVAVVSGAGSGLGRALALLLGKAGCRVALVGRRRGPLERTAELMEFSSPPLVLPGDVSVSTDVEKVSSAIFNEAGCPHILVNNAAVFPKLRPLQDLPIAEWDDTIATNLRGPVLLIRAFLPKMLELNYGRILNISAPLKHYPGASAYCASKCALDSLTKALSYENKSANVLINAVEPPMMNTEMHTGGADPNDIAPQLLAYLDPAEITLRGRIIKLST